MTGPFKRGFLRAFAAPTLVLSMASLEAAVDHCACDTSPSMHMLHVRRQEVAADSYRGEVLTPPQVMHSFLVCTLNLQVASKVKSRRLRQALALVSRPDRSTA